MIDKKTYQETMQAQLDALQVEVEELRAKANQQDVDSQHEISKHLRTLDNKIEEGKSKLSELLEANGEAWDSVKDGFENTWNALKNSVTEVVSKYK